MLEGKQEALLALHRSAAVAQPVRGPHQGGFALVPIAVVPGQLETGLRVVGLNNRKGPAGHIVAERALAERHPGGVLDGRVDKRLAQRSIGRFPDGNRKIAGLDIAQNLRRQHIFGQLGG